MSFRKEVCNQKELTLIHGPAQTFYCIFKSKWIQTLLIRKSFIKNNILTSYFIFIDILSLHKMNLSFQDKSLSQATEPFNSQISTSKHYLLLKLGNTSYQEAVESECLLKDVWWIIILKPTYWHFYNLIQSSPKRKIVFKMQNKLYNIYFSNISKCIKD